MMSDLLPPDLLPPNLLPPDLLQRASGGVRLQVALRHGATRIAALRQEGCLKLLFPRLAGAPALQAVTVNCSGGIAAGDRLETDLTCGPGTDLVLTAQAAERCYKARSGELASVVEARVRLDRTARLHWLPQETILFDGACLRRRLHVEMASDACFLGLESRVFGRRLHGERLRRLELSDRVVISRSGRPVLVDAIELHGDAEAALSRVAIGAGAAAAAIGAGAAAAATGVGAAAAATIMLVAPDAEARLDPVRAVLRDDAGASAWDGMLRVSIVSQDAGRHRALVADVLSVLRDGAPLPSVWRC